MDINKEENKALLNKTWTHLLLIDPLTVRDFCRKHSIYQKGDLFNFEYDFIMNRIVADEISCQQVLNLTVNPNYLNYGKNIIGWRARLLLKNKWPHLWQQYKSDFTQYSHTVQIDYLSEYNWKIYLKDRLISCA